MLQPHAHKAKLQQKLPAMPKFSIGEHVHYRDFTRNRPKWVAGKVTGHVGMKMFIFQGPDGHCRRHEDHLKLRSVPKLNRQRRLNRSYSTGALEFGLEKKCRKLIFSGYISGLPLIKNLMSPQKCPLRVFHNLHIN